MLSTAVQRGQVWGDFCPPGKICKFFEEFSKNFTSNTLAEVKGFLKGINFSKPHLQSLFSKNTSLIESPAALNDNTDSITGQNQGNKKVTWKMLRGTKKNSFFFRKILAGGRWGALPPRPPEFWLGGLHPQNLPLTGLAGGLPPPGPPVFFFPPLTTRAPPTTIRRTSAGTILIKPTPRGRA